MTASGKELICFAIPLKARIGFVRYSNQKWEQFKKHL